MKTMNPKTTAKIALALLACSAALTVKGDYPSTVISQGPVGYWRLGETTPPPAPMLATNIGSAAPNFNGSYVGDSARGLTGPFAGSKAVSFNGSQAVEDAYAAGLNPQSFSIEAWLNPNSSNVSGGLICALASVQAGSPRAGWLVYQSDTVANAGVGQGFNFRLYNLNGTAVSASVLGASNLVGGTWYHVVATYDEPSKAAKVYINGVLAGSGTATTNTASGNR